MVGKSAIVRVAIVADNVGLTRGLADSQSKMAKFGKSIAKAGLLAGAVAGAALLKMADAAVEDQKAQAQLAQTLKTTTGATDAQVASVEDWITAQGKALGVADDDLRPALARLATATGSVAEAQKLASLAMDVSAGTGKDLATVTAALAKAQNGSLGGLSKLGIATKDAAGQTMTLAQVTADLQQKFSGAAATAAGTTAGQFERVKLQISELGESIGGALLPTLTDLGQWLLDTGVPALEDLGAAAKTELGPALQDLTGWVADNKSELQDLGSTVLAVVVPALETTGHVVAAVVGFFGKLPGPIKETVVVVVAAALIFNNKLKPAIDSTTSSTRQSIAAFQQWRAELTYTETRAGAVATATKKMSGAMRAAAGAGGLALLAASGDETNDSLATMEQTLGSVALGFSVGGPWGAAIAYAIDSVNQLRTANDDMNAALDAVDTAKASGSLDAWGKALDSAREKTDEATLHFRDLAFGTSTMQGALSTLPKALNYVTGATDDANAKLDEQQIALEAARRAAQHATGPEHDYGTALQNAAAAAQQQADAIVESVDAMRKKRQESLRALNAELDYQAAIDDATASLKDNGKTVDATTEKGRNNLRNLYALADAWNGQSDAVKSAKGSLGAARQNFVDVAVAMGKSEDAAKRLAARLFEIPTKRTTEVRVDGIDVAVNKAEGLKAQLDKLKSKDIYVALHYQTIGNKPPATTPGVPNPREQAQGSHKMQAYGERLGDAMRAGIEDSARKHKQSLADALFGGKPGLDTISAGLDRVTALIDRTVSKRIADDKKAAKVTARIVDHLGEQFAALRKIGKQQDDNTQSLDAASAAYAAYAANVKQAVVESGNITDLGRLDSGRVSLTRLLSQLRKRAADASEFSRLLQQLAAAGLDQTQIEQLQAAGVETGLATARAIAQGGAAAVAEVNSLSESIAASGSTLGDALADRFSVAGQSSALSYITTLEGEQKRLNAVADKMAQRLVNQVQAALAGVKSQPEHKPPKQGGTPDQSTGTDRTQVNVRLTAQQLNSLERGREIQADLDVYRNAGGRARV